MGDLRPVAFDIETSGLGDDAVVTVAGFATEMGSWLALNTTGRAANASHIENTTEHESGSHVRVSIHPNEGDLLRGLDDFVDEHIDGDRDYLTAYNGEVWNGGFDLPFLRRACIRRDADWPFADIAYADVMDMVDRFHTGDANDLERVYDALVGGSHCDPFDESASAVKAHEEGNWVPLLLHNLADIERTRELALLAGRYVPKSDFSMKNLRPPDV